MDSVKGIKDVMGLIKQHILNFFKPDTLILNQCLSELELNLQNLLYSVRFI